MKNLMTRTIVAVVAAAGIILPITGVNAIDMVPAERKIIEISPVGKIAPIWKSNIEFVSERIEIDGDLQRGCSLWIYLTVRNKGPFAVSNVQVKFNVQEFLANSSLNTEFAPENLTTTRFSLAPGGTFEVSYRLSSRVWYDEEHNRFFNRHYSAEILNVNHIDADTTDNLLIRSVERTSGTETL